MNRETFINTASLAYLDGQQDGNEWGLELGVGIEYGPKGWDESTLNAMGATACARTWGVDRTDDEAFAQACREYNAGCWAAISARLRTEGTKS